MIIHKKLTKNKKCFGESRDLKYIKYIVIHYTGNENDTAKGNCNYFQNGNLTRFAGAHYFVDDKGVWQSVALNKTAYSVGASSADKSDGGAEYYNKCNNSNSVSIELCDAIRNVSKKQIKYCKKLVKKIQKKCPNATKIIRHWDVTGKDCPLPFIGKNNKKWKEFKNEIKGEK